VSQRCAVIGTGQTHHAAARRDVTMGGLVREAAERALLDADLDWGDVEAVVLGKAPDILEGVMSPELSLAGALAAVGKPIVRAYTSGNAGGMAASVGVGLIAAGVHARVLVVAFEKQSDAQAAGATLQHVPFEASWSRAGTGSLFGALCRE
jgi:acetyl-CoA C-acetyltransferase